MQSNLSYDPCWEIPSLTAQEKQVLLKALDQPFTYLGKGSQCYVFESKDGEYILKFFRYERYRFPRWIQSLSLPPFLEKIQKANIENKEKKRLQLFQSCHLAYQELREETGLLFLHLNKTKEIQTIVPLKDKLGFVLPIELDHYEFIVQKKAKLIYPSLNEWIEQGQLEIAKAALIGIFSLLSKRYEKGIVDYDLVLQKNAGFLGNQPIFIDVGQFAKDEKMKDPYVQKEETEKALRKLRAWLEMKCRPLAELVEDESKTKAFELDFGEE